MGGSSLDRGRGILDMGGSSLDKGRGILDKGGSSLDKGRGILDKGGSSVDKGRGILDKGGVILDMGGSKKNGEKTIQKRTKNVSLPAQVCHPPRRPFQTAAVLCYGSEHEATQTQGD